LNAIEFSAAGTVVRPLELPLLIRDQLERSLLLFYTGASRNAATILREQRASSQEQDATVIESLHGIKRDAEIARDALRTGDIRHIGQILHESWQRKKRLASGISNERIDRLYQLALEHGAGGGKIAGAGGGGFLLLFCEPEHQPTVTRVLEAEGLTRMTFHFDDGGAQVLVNSMPEIPGLAYPEGRWVGSGVASV
jgi:D-glycero-alpha-D-manno-heptose-7-phosphate kinase